MRIAAAGLALLAITAPAQGEILKFMIPSEKGLSAKWWPKVPALPGWHQDQGASEHFSLNALAPDGSTFARAEAVMMAKANYKPRQPKITTLAQLVEDDRKSTLAVLPDARITALPDMKDADGKRLLVRAFAPGKDGKGNWEAVAYGEEGDFFLIFTLSARSQKSYQQNFKMFETLVARYAK